MRTSLLVLVVVVSACSPASMPDAGAGGGGSAGGGVSGGGSTAGGSVAGGVTGGGAAAGGSTAGGSTAGGVTGGGSAAGGSTAGGSTALPDGGVATIMGPTSFAVTAVRSVVSAAQPSVLVTALYNAPPVTCSTTPNAPFSVLVIRVTNTDGGAVTVGTWPIDGVRTKVTRDDFLTTGQGPDGGEATSGTVTITRLESGRSSGTFSASMTFYSLSSGTLTGSWDAPVCP